MYSQRGTYRQRLSDSGRGDGPRRRVPLWRPLCISICRRASNRPWWWIFLHASFWTAHFSAACCRFNGAVGIGRIRGSWSSQTSNSGGDSLARRAWIRCWNSSSRRQRRKVSLWCEPGAAARTEFGRHVMESHRALAKLPCAHAPLFQEIADRLARELAGQGQVDEEPEDARTP